MCDRTLGKGDRGSIDIGKVQAFIATLSTSPHPELRNADWAVELATKACELTGYQDPSAIASLAIAQAARKDHAAAIKNLDK